MIDGEEVPRNTDVTYLIEPAPQVEPKEESEAGATQMGGQDASVVFCVDISGSMNTSQAGVTRFRCVKTAIEAQIEEMAKGAGERKVGIVTFNDHV